MPLSPSETRALLDALGHRPKRKLGQNFLIDGNIVRKSLELSNTQPGDNIVEIGPGLGTLTEALLDVGAHVHAVEKDPKLAQRIAALADAYPDKLSLTEGDALEFPLADLPESETRFKIVANLPYAISTPWMASVLDGRLPVSMTLMLQKEAAQRYTAAPGSKQCGSISVLLQAAYDVANSHDVSAACFYPKPDVGSTLLHLSLKSEPYVFSQDGKNLMRGVFQQRRKQIGALLRQNGTPMAKLWEASLETIGIDPKARPEQIEVAQWIELDRSSEA